jgi:multidrug efflux pump subunit AcrA (membrane-fusion protein)
MRQSKWKIPLRVNALISNCFQIRSLRLALCMATVLAILGGVVLAYNSAARNSLLKSRDQVADQRAQLERAYSDVDRTIDQLQEKKFAIGRYLQDCDRSIKELDRALSAQDAAVRDIR